MMGSETTGQNTQTQFEMRNAISTHAFYYVITLQRRNKRAIERKQRAIQSDTLKIAQLATCSFHKRCEVTWEVML